MPKLNFKISFHTKDGSMGVIINGIRYIYHLDAGFIPEIVRKAKHAPGRSLSLLKEVAYSYERK